jgi:peptidoglycan/xylan/chitin deacetylase (PgdA/CDA1 family)/glycosyltransferase involved in cell wall biosynthesis
MKLLIVTQAIDIDDPVLGFFCRWVEEFAKHTEHIEVICLKMGRFNSPKNVCVHSLGKERGASRVEYAINFYRYIWDLRHDYDAVFVHMNQEYILIAGWLWRLLGKRVYLWRNHYAGSWLTDVAAAFCTKVFCTSRHSYTAKYAKTELMPVGVDTERFTPDANIARKPHSVLFLSRMSPSKRPEMLIDALAELARSGADFNATLVGSPLPRDEAYHESLKEKVRELKLADRITFLSGVPNSQTPDLYRAHEIFVNTSPSGMLDKTLFEAAACGCRVLSSSADFADLAGSDSRFGSAAELADRLNEELRGGSRQNDTFVERHSLMALGGRLTQAMTLRRRAFRELVWSVLHALARFSRQPQFTILLYHSISANSDPFAVSPLEFDRQMRYVTEHADTVPLAHAFLYAAGRPIQRDTVVVTFDDGYQDFATEALPVLQRYGIPTTVFVLGGKPNRAELANDHPLVTPADAPGLKASGVAIGSHGSTHRKLTRISSSELAAELRDSRETISAQFDSVPVHLAYPKGSFNAVVMRAAREAGYEGAVTVVERGVRVGDDAFALPRVLVAGDTSPGVFAAKLTRAADWYRVLWRLVHPWSR